MKALLGSLVAIALSLCCGKAEEVDAAIAPLVAKHREEIAKLMGKTEESKGFARDAYLVLLDKVEAEIVDKGDTAGIAAIASDRQSAKLNALGSSPPANLPKKLQSPRKACLKEFDKQEADLEKAAKKVNAAHIAALNSVPGTAEKPALADQIAAEKKRLLYGIGKPVLNLQTDLKGTRWIYPGKPGVMHFSADGKWQGQPFSTPKPNVVVFNWTYGGSVTLTLGEFGNVLMAGDKIDMVLYRGQVR